MSRTDLVQRRDVADAINREHEAACQEARSALEHARRAGELLLEAKGRVEHGAWLPWLAEHCPTISPRVAQMYMRVAQHWPKLEAATDAKRVSYLPVREALALLAEPRPPAEIFGDQEAIDWPARTATMEAAWDDLGAAQDDLQARLGQATDLETAVDNLHAATELEGRAVALQASTIRDLRRLTRELATLLDLLVERVRVLTQPNRTAAFLAACQARIAELSEGGDT